MKIDVLTLFSDMFAGPFAESIVKRAVDKGLVEINVHNLRDWANDKHKTVDSPPYGGGAGMVMRVDVVDRALQALRTKTPKHKNTRTILLTPQGKPFKQSEAKRLAKINHLILIAGHYEGFDERIRDHLVDEEISIGDYVLTGGELPAMVVVDTVVRLLPRVRKKESTEDESFSENLLEYPQYTRPDNYNDWEVPEVLKSGDHSEINKWRKNKSLERTNARRPELLD